MSIVRIARNGPNLYWQDVHKLANGDPMSAAKPHRLLCVGAVHIDDTATPLGSLVAKASNPVRWSHSIGGVSANALRAARRELPMLDIDFIAAVGDDTLAQTLADALQQQTINTRFVTLDNTPTGRYSVILDQHGELFIGLADVDNAERLTLEQFVHKVDAITPDAVLIDTNLHAKTITSIAHHVEQHWQCPLLGLAVSPAKVVKLLAIREQLAVLICNRREAIALLQTRLQTRLQMGLQTRPQTTLQSGKSSTGKQTDIATTTPSPSNSGFEHASTEALALALIDSGFSRFVLSDGADPVFVFEDDQLKQLAVPSLTIESTVNGAGDAMAGAIVAHWVNGTKLFEAVKTAGLPAASRILTGEIPPQRLA